MPLLVSNLGCDFLYLPLLERTQYDWVLKTSFLLRLRLRCHELVTWPRLFLITADVGQFLVPFVPGGFLVGVVITRAVLTVELLL